MRTTVNRAFEIEEPIPKGDLTPYVRFGLWTDLLRDVAARLATLDGLVIPVKFETLRSAQLCRLSLSNRRKHSARYQLLDERLRCSQRQDRVFFWLEKDEVPA